MHETKAFRVHWPRPWGLEQIGLIEADTETLAVAQIIERESMRREVESEAYAHFRPFAEELVGESAAIARRLLARARGIMTYTTIDQHDGARLRLVRCDGTSRCTVVRFNPGAHQVYDAMPGDAPDGGGSWCARDTDAGIGYVATTYSRNYARRIYSRLVREYAEVADCLGAS